jgi:hypothetical protein
VRKVLAVIIIVLIGYIGAESFKYQLKNRKEVEKETSETKEYDVLDGLIGRQAIGQFNRVKELRDSFNIPAFKTTMVMFYTQNGRYPNTIEELDRSGDASHEMTHDRYGNLYSMQLNNNKHVLLQSAGRDRISGTTDDVEYTFDL